VQIVEKHRVKAIYLAPTAIRDMMAHDDDYVLRHDRSSLEVCCLLHIHKYSD
jgi:acyl-coenzyme A synthetase/AMP-(fatty) acid ligase